MWKTLTIVIRIKRMIILNVASSGISSLLLFGGKRTHSTFCTAFLINEE